MTQRRAVPATGRILTFANPISATGLAAGVLLIAQILSGPSLAATWVVHPDGTGDAANLQSAVADAASGDTILLGPGTFTGQKNRGVVIAGKDLFVESMSGPAATIIDCQDADRAFSVLGGETLILGITVRHGASPFSGGAIYASEATVTLKSCWFQDNSGSGESGAGGGGAVYASGGTLVVSNCRFDRNFASSPNGAGGGICVESNGNVFVTDSHFEANYTGPGQYSGGAGLFAWLAQDVVVDGCTFSDNTAVDAAALFLLSETATIARCDFSRNTAVTVVSTLALAPSEITDCTFASNNGGALAISTGATVTACAFLGNSAAIWGGGVFAGGVPTSFVDCIFAGNSAAGGGGVCITGSAPATFDRCTFVDNAASIGAHVYTRFVANVELTHCILAFASGAAISCESGGTVVTTCCDVYGNTGGDYVACLSGQDGAAGNFSADPQFCDAGSGDYTLRSNSPCAPPGATACGLIGAHPVSCGPTAMETRSWASVKALYHD